VKATSHVTLRAVADLAKVSTATASRVLNNSARVAAGTRRRVLAAAEALHYTPDEAGRALARRRSRIAPVRNH